MKLSIIIPAYRVEGTLDRCIESVVSQDYDDMEIILVDDGSPDKCPEMCDEWGRKDSRIKVIHKQNGGLSDARNAGIDIAEGDYLTFVDSDDYIDGNTYAPLMQMAASDSEVDILEYPTRELDFNPQTVYSNMDDYWYLSQAYLHTYAWNKIYRRELFDDIRFPQGKVFEDAHTLPLLLEKARKLITTNKGYYHYSHTPNGITATADGEALDSLLQAHVTVINNATHNDASFQLYYMHVTNIQMDVYELTGRAPILPKRRIDPSNIRGLMKLKAIMLNLVGIDTLCKLNKMIHKIWRNH